MHRAVRIPLDRLTQRKLATIRELLVAYRAGVRFMLRSLWRVPGKLDAATESRLVRHGTRLSARYVSAVTHQALAIIASTKAGAKVLCVEPGEPTFGHGGAILDAKFVTIEPSESSKEFDFVLRLSTLVKRDRISLPFKATRVLREWLAVPGARLVQGCELNEDHAILWVELPDVEPRPSAEGDVVLGIDVGYTKLIATSRGEFLGTNFPEISARIRRRKPGSKGKKRALRARDQAVGEAVNRLPWDKIDVIGLEDLKGIKFGKRKGQTKTWRRKRASWTATAVEIRARRRAAERAKRVIVVDPRGTSITCPECGHVDKKNRVRSVFRCVKCGFAGDADHVGALNVKTKTEDALHEERVYGRPASPVVGKRNKNNRRGAAPFVARVVIAQGGRALPAPLKTGPRDEGSPRNCAPDSHEPGQGGGAFVARRRSRRQAL